MSVFRWSPVVFFYSLIVGLLFYPLLPLALLWVLLSGWQRQDIGQRFALYPTLPGKGVALRIWLHAASVGEAGALALLSAELRRQLPGVQLVVSTMTLHGREAARRKLPADIPCLLAPLDLPGIAGRAIRRISPDIYLTVETELWPLVLQAASKNGVAVALLNGRLSERSFPRYRRLRWLFSTILHRFSLITVISERDKRRYQKIGAPRERLHLFGNCKYDRQLDLQQRQLCQNFARQLAISGEEVLLCGSTHGGEEEMLLPVWAALASERPMLCLIAPRHLQRLPKITAWLEQQGVAFDLFSELLAGKKRCHRLIIIDTYGDLPVLYGLADYVFCGGSLVEKGGHNVMEAALWEKAVLHGPSMADFQDAADLLAGEGAAFPVANAAEMTAAIRTFRQHPDGYRKACRRAGKIAREQSGSARRQISALVQALARERRFSGHVPAERLSAAE